MGNNQYQIKQGRTAVTVIVSLVIFVIAGGALVYSYWQYRNSTREEIAVVDVSAENTHSHDHPHGTVNSVTLSPTALKNIRYKPFTISLGSYQRSISMPGMVIERPGKSQVRVSASLTGVVTKIYVHPGEAIEQATPLFDIRPTHEDLVTAQSEYLATIESLDVVQAEIKRLESLPEGVIAGKRVIEMNYERRKLDGRLQSQRQALLLHGLNDNQIDDISNTRKLLRSLTIRAPIREDNDQHPYHVQSVEVQLGQQVTSGETLCILADHCELYIEGTAFEADTPTLRRVLETSTPIDADILVGTEREEVVKGLKVLFLADQVDRDSRARHFYVQLPNEIVSDRNINGQRFVQWHFSPGQRVELNLPVDRWTERIVVPEEAVVTEGAETYVYRQSGNSFERVPVHVEHRDQKNAVIKNDGALFPGEVIAGRGAFQIHLALKNASGGPVDPHAGHTH